MYNHIFVLMKNIPSIIAHDCSATSFCSSIALKMRWNWRVSNILFMVLSRGISVFWQTGLSWGMTPLSIPGFEITTKILSCDCARQKSWAIWILVRINFDKLGLNTLISPSLDHLESILINFSTFLELRYYSTSKNMSKTVGSSKKSCTTKNFVAKIVRIDNRYRNFLPWFRTLVLHKKVFLCRGNQIHSVMRF